MKCKNHSDKEIEFHCFACNGDLCHGCVKEWRHRHGMVYSCKGCGGRCESMDDLAEEGESLAHKVVERKLDAQIQDALIGPFTKNRLLPMLQRALVLSCFTWGMVMPPIGTIIIFPPVFIYLMANFMHIIGLNTSSETQASDVWQRPVGFAEWIPQGLIAWGLLLWCSLPALLTQNPIWTLFSFYIFPMYLLTVVIEESFSSFNPLALILRIKKFFIPYSFFIIPWFLFAFYCRWFLKDLFLYGAVLDGVNLFNHLLFIPLPWFFVRWCIFVYLMLVSTRLLGIFYRQYKEDLAFKEIGPRLDSWSL